MYGVEVKALEPMRLAALRHRGPYHEIGLAFERIYGWAGERGLAGPESQGVGLFYDDPQVTAASELRSVAGVVVADAVQADPAAEVEIVEVAGGEYAVLTHRGSYEKLPEVYPWLYGEWLAGSGRAPDDRPSVEIYLNNCAEHPPEDLLTEIRIPLAPVS